MVGDRPPRPAFRVFQTSAGASRGQGRQHERGDSGARIRASSPNLLHHQNEIHPVSPEDGDRHVRDYRHDFSVKLVQELFQVVLVLGHPEIESVDSVFHQVTSRGAWGHVGLRPRGFESLFPLQKAKHGLWGRSRNDWASYQSGND